jgi:hypothetical protein
MSSLSPFHKRKHAIVFVADRHQRRRRMKTKQEMDGGLARMLARGLDPKVVDPLLAELERSNEALDVAATAHEAAVARVLGASRDASIAAHRHADECAEQATRMAVLR